MDEAKALIPLSANCLGGPFVETAEGFEILARRGRLVVVRFYSKPDAADWFDDFELMYCQFQHDEATFKVIRPATDDERRLFRIPLWIQGEESPDCCGQPMHFVGQIDDDRICTERPPDAKLWWHDLASFYVFTCSQCLECKVVGQQF